MTFTTPSPGAPPPGAQQAATHPGVPPGWHSDPWRVGPWRWWDGYGWTAYVWPPQGAWAQPAWPAGPAEPAPRGFRRAFWPSIGWTLLAMLAAVAAGAASTVAAMVLGAGEATALAVFMLVFYPVMFGGFWYASRRLSRTYGTADMRADYGWMRFRAADVGWGLLAAAGALVAQVLIGLALRQPDDGAYRDAVFGEDPSRALLVGMGIAIVVGAPLFEELVFRGPIMRSLIERFGAWVGLILQGGVFALYHVVGNPTLITVWYLTPLFVVGVIFGLAAHHTGRLATAQIAHAAMNSVAFVALLSSL